MKIQTLALTALLFSTPAFAQNAAPLAPKETVVIDNDDVRVTRVEIPAGAVHIPSQIRMKRVIVWLTPGNDQKVLKETGVAGQENLTRQFGQVGFRAASNGTAIESKNDHTTVSLIIELKH